jgi:hypothetical protein
MKRGTRGGWNEVNEMAADSQLEAGEIGQQPKIDGSLGLKYRHAGNVVVLRGPGRGVQDSAISWDRSAGAPANGQ